RRSRPQRCSLERRGSRTSRPPASRRSRHLLSSKRRPQVPWPLHLSAPPRRLPPREDSSASPPEATSSSSKPYRGLSPGLCRSRHRSRRPLYSPDSRRLVRGGRYLREWRDRIPQREDGSSRRFTAPRNVQIVGNPTCDRIGIRIRKEVQV